MIQQSTLNLLLRLQEPNHTQVERAVMLQTALDDMKKTKLKQVSKAKAKVNDAYSKEKRARIQRNPKCECCHERTTLLDGHHPYGQAGKWIMVFVLVCRPCHDEITQNPNRARDEGWICDNRPSDEPNEAVKRALALAQ